MLTLSQAQGGGSRSLPSSCRSPAHLAGGGTTGGHRVPLRNPGCGNKALRTAEEACWAVSDLLPLPTHRGG